jgi:hypothetical protein
VELTFRVRLIVLIIAVLLSGATPASPQPTGLVRIPPGVFGGSSDRPMRHKLDFSVSLIEAKDSEPAVDLRDVLPPDTVLGGYSTMFVGNVEYRWQGPRVQVGAVGESALRYYSQVQAVKNVSHTAGVGLSAHLGERTMIMANQTAVYTPSYLYGLFLGDSVSKPGVAVPAAPDYAIRDADSYSYGTTLTLTQGLTRRSRLSATGTFDYTNFVHQTASQPNLRSQGMHGEFSRNLARHTAVRIGYGYRNGAFGYGDVSATEHVLGAGVEHTRVLSATRRMVFEFNVSSSSLSVPASNPGSASGSLSGNLYRLSADAGLGWQFSTAWQAHGRFRRGLEFVAGLSEPVYVDGFAAELAGLVTPRLDVVASGRYSSGKSALYREALTFDTYGAELQIRYALMRGLAVYGEYLYYFYDFTGNARLAPGIPPGLERNGIRAGLTLWVPAFRR